MYRKISGASEVESTVPQRSTVIYMKNSVYGYIILKISWLYMLYKNTSKIDSTTIGSEEVNRSIQEGLRRRLYYIEVYMQNTQVDCSIDLELKGSLKYIGRSRISTVV